MRGSSANDTLEGGNDSDTLDGGADDDRLRGDSGNDILHGQDGRDDLDGGEGNDLLYGGTGDDALLGSGGNDTLWGGTGNDALEGYGDDDVLYGEEGNDILKGGEGVDTLFGAVGDDKLYGGAGTDTLVGDAGDDHLYGDGGNDTLDGGIGFDKLWGGEGDDTLDGGDGDDVLAGDAGNDSLRGALGDDMLSGGQGADTLDGGGGNDQLFGNDGNDILFGGPDVDYVDGGAGIDTIVLTGVRSDYEIRFNTAIGRFSIVDQRGGSPDGTDLADIEIFRFSDGDIKTADLNYMTGADRDIAWDAANSDGSKSTLGWRTSSQFPTQLETFIQHRTIAGVLMSETIFQSDGSHTAYALDVSNDPKIVWTSYVQSYDTEARLTEQVYENDDGTQRIEKFDPDNAYGEAWSYQDTRLSLIGGLWLSTWQLDTLDEPIAPIVDPSVVDYIEREWDRLGAANWSEVVREFQTYSTGHWLTEETKYDDASLPFSRIYKGQDFANDHLNYGSDAAHTDWESFEERYDAGNRKYWESYTYFDRPIGNNVVEPGHTELKQWDYNNQAWSESTLYTVGLDKKLWQEVLYDLDPTYSKTHWEWHYVPGEWTERVTYYDKYVLDRVLYQEDKWIDSSTKVLVKGIITQKDFTALDWSEVITKYNYNAAAGVNEYYESRTKKDNGEYIIYESDLYGQHSEYSVRTRTFTDATETKTLRDEILLDKAIANGVILTVERIDQYKIYKNWEKYYTTYKENPDASDPKKYLPVHSIATIDLKTSERFERSWDYSTKTDWKYEVLGYDAKNFNYFKAFLYDGNDTYRRFDYDPNNGGEDWKVIEQFFYEQKPEALAIKKVTYDDAKGGRYDERWDPLKKNEDVDGKTYEGGWTHIYREWNKGGTLIRHWYIDDLNGYHELINTDTTDDNVDTPQIPDGPGDPSGGGGGGASDPDSDSSGFRSILAMKDAKASWMFL